MAAILDSFQVAPYAIFFNRWKTIVGENFVLVAKMAQFTPKICTELLEYTAVGIGDFETVIGYRLL